MNINLEPKEREYFIEKREKLKEQSYKKYGIVMACLGVMVSSLLGMGLGYKIDSSTLVMLYYSIISTSMAVGGLSANKAIGLENEIEEIDKILKNGSDDKLTNEQVREENGKSR